MLVDNRFDAELIITTINDVRLKTPDARLIVLTDIDLVPPDNVVVVDARQSGPGVLAQMYQEGSSILYAIDQDDIGYRFVRFMIENSLKFIPVWSADPARYVHKDRHARKTIEDEFQLQTIVGFAKFDSGFGDFENICQALSATRHIAGSYLEVGCYLGSSGSIALKYMREAGIFRPSFFFDVFEGFNYDAAQSSVDAVWNGTHMTDGVAAVASRLKRFENAALGRPVTVAQSNIITDELPSDIGQIAVANLDVDLLEAVYAGLVKIAPKMAIGGILIVEDPGHTPALAGAHAAMELFLATPAAKAFTPVYMSSGQYFLVRNI